LKIVYHPRFVFGSWMLNWFHPFEFNRAQLAMERLQSDYGSKLDGRVLRPEQPVTFEDLALVHDQAYLDSLSKNLTVTRVIEAPLLSLAPRKWVEEWFLTPALWSVAGSLLAARTAMETGGCLSLGGGFHHAKRQGGEGFCLFNDIAFFIETLRHDGTLGREDSILYVDLDVHQGNGVSCDYQHDPTVKIMDAYNKAIYPVFFGAPQGRVDVAVPIEPKCSDVVYLEALEKGLNEFRALADGCKLMIYNAGTDVFQEDKLGGLSLTHEGVNKRDLLVLQMAQELGVPMVVLASGGYSKTSATLLGDFASAVLNS
jgi:histone deacetylase 11